MLNFSFLLKIFLCISILFSVLICKLFFFEELKSTFFKKIYYDYVTDNKKEVILEKIEKKILLSSLEINKIIPNKIKTSIKNNYYDSIKPFILSFKVTDVLSFSRKTEDIQKNSEINNISKEEDINKSINESSSVGIGGFQPIETEKVIEDVSAISSVDNELDILKSNKIKLIKPVEGIITSRYGFREKVFDGVNPYHTGLDIGNKINTLIKSASNGIVKNIVYGDKYYGNYIEVTIENIIFKYAHLNSINVKINQPVSIGSEIGKMGSTGMSTGSHLHFEIRVETKTINPEEVIEF
jgi:murein DD-endopeptidase MepM/ murein hydrolase activator NlpD